MPTPLDMLIGPALRHPQGPREGEAPGSRAPRSSPVATGAKVTAVAVAAWALRVLVRRARVG